MSRKQKRGPAGSCRVQIMLPDGSKILRRFMSDTRVETLYDAALAASKEAAGGRPFSLKPRGKFYYLFYYFILFLFVYFY